MDKKTAVENFKSGYDCIRTALKNDRCAVKESWSYYTDSLHRDGEISDWQVNNWTSPFEKRQIKKGN